MSEVTENPVESHIESLRKKADLMGLKYHHKAGVEKLQAIINEHLGESTSKEESLEIEAKKPSAVPLELPAGTRILVNGKETKAQRAKRLHDTANTLVRVSITCMNPNKKDWEGEVFTVANRTIGTIKKYVPFNQEFHVPMAIFKMIQQRKCQIFKRERNNGRITSRAMLIKEFGINELPPLTQDEIVEIGKQQAAAGVIR